MPTSPDGRLVCRLHGHSYSVGIFPLIIGRAPECAIVVTENDVSRQHACVMRTPTGYVVVDTSTARRCPVNETGAGYLPDPDRANIPERCPPSTP